MQTHSLDLESTSSQYASISDALQTGLDITGDLTIEAWVKLESAATQTVVSKYDDTSNNVSYMLRVTNTGDVYFYVSSDGTNATFDNIGSGVIKVGVWQHIAVTYNSAAGTCEFYVNGRNVASGTGLATSIFNGSARFAVGVSNTSDALFDGLIKDVRVFNDIRTAAEVAADAAAQTVSNANLKGEWNFNNAATDSSGNGNNLTLSGSPSYSTTIPWEDAPDVSGSTYLETNLVSWWTMNEASGTRNDSKGSNHLTDNNTVGSATGKQGNGADFEASNSEYLSIADGSQSGLEPAGDFSISLWANVETSPSGGGQVELVSKYDETGYRLNYQNNSGTLRLRVILETPSGTADVGTFNYTLTPSSWFHIVWTFDSSAKLHSLYVNGILVGTFTGTNHAAVPNTGHAFQIGAGLSSGSPTRFFDGILDEVGFYARELHYGDILDLYNGGNGITYNGSTPVTVTPSALSATFSIPSPSVTAVRNVTSAPSTLAVTASIPAPSVSGAAIISPAALSASFSIPTPAVLIPNTTATPSALSATFSIPSPTLHADCVLTVSPLSAIVSVIAPSISTIRNITLTPSPLSLTFSIEAIRVYANPWHNQAASSTSFSNQAAASTSWINQSPTDPV